MGNPFVECYLLGHPVTVTPLSESDVDLWSWDYHGYQNGYEDIYDFDELHDGFDEERNEEFYGDN